jgi:aspartyl-tRNA synthetase
VIQENCYRSKSCGDLRAKHVGEFCRLAGWVHRKRDHGQLIFLDLRDHYGLTQCVMSPEYPEAFRVLEKLPVESVVCVYGKIVLRSPETLNKKMETGEVELVIQELQVLSFCQQVLPLTVNSDQAFPEDTRLRYRFLDLRRHKMHQRIVLRSQVIASLRQRMIDQGFLEIQTPILTASSPEGARDYLVPSRLYPGKFYALPQAPQQFKQMLMASGFDKYFQIAPCFRDEDARSDRSPGEFYQLDFEMAFVTQDDVFKAIEPVLHGVFTQFGGCKTVTAAPFPRITYEDAMLVYGSDKPDLRNPLVIKDLSDFFRNSSCEIFAKPVAQGHCVRAIKVARASDQSRKFFDDLNQWAQDQGMPGLGYISLKEGALKGPLVKFLSQEEQERFSHMMELVEGDVVFFVCQNKKIATELAGKLRTKLGQAFDLIEANVFAFCWVVDFPMYEWDEQLKKIVFSHNPFSMPQGGMEALCKIDPLEIKAFQYDIVCNGVELSSGAIRNHLPEVMEKAFEIAGYSSQEFQEQFGGLLRAFEYGAPPHGGSAPGIDRIVMMLADEPNIREIIPFPMNQNAQDVLMGAPAVLSPERLQELHLMVRPKS